jgi:hypothetical protein
MQMSLTAVFMRRLHAFERPKCMSLEKKGNTPLQSSLMTPTGDFGYSADQLEDHKEIFPKIPKKSDSIKTAPKIESAFSQSSSSHASMVEKMKESKRAFRKKTRSETTTPPEESWLLVKKDELESVYINEELYNKLGITAFRGPFAEVENVAGPARFSFNSRELTFTNDSKQLTFVASKTKTLMKQLQQFSDQQRTATILDALPLQTSPAKTTVAELIKEYSADDAANNLVVFNPKRREEVFLPFTIKGSEHGKFGLHMYPWLSKSEGAFNFTGFKNFATALCMFGSSLKGVDQGGGSFPLIKHDIHLFNGQQITNIALQQPNPYEEAQLEDLERLTHLIRNLSPSTTTPKLYCHFPHYDYILFCLELFSANKMTEKALEKAAKTILKKTEGYVKRIESVCKKQNIEAITSSPFDNIFGKANSYDEIEQIFDKLSETENEEQDLNEAHLVQNCLKLLTTNHFKESHRQVWQDFIAVIGEKNITSLESLFKVGNAVMVAIAAYGQQAYETCSLLGLSEKQIQISYTELSKKSKHPYPAVVNLTYLDPCLGYNLAANKGNLFYFDESRTLTSQILSHGILKSARKNAATSVGGENHSPLQEVLEKIDGIIIEKPISSTPSKSK